MRIALAGIATESCTFSPIRTRLEDFVIVRGDDLLEARGYDFMEDDLTLVPLLHARALPSGPVEPEVYQGLKREFLEGLRAALSLDGLYLDMHGAMNVENMDDAEGDWITSARQIVGPECLISASYDLHGNVSKRVIENLDILTAFRTAPHIDVLETRQRAFNLLLRCLRENVRPERAWVRVPVLLPGERTSTEWEPAAGLYASLAEIDEVPGVLDASLLVGYLWADEPRSSAGVVITGLDRETIGREAKVLAKRYWDLRKEFTFGVPAGSLDDCIRWTLQAPEYCIFISDSGDNITAGGVGDMPHALERLLAHRVNGAVLGGITDREAAKACYAAGVGAEVKLSLGGKLDPTRSKPLAIAGRIIYLHPDDKDKQAVLQVEGVKVIVTEKRRPFHHAEDFRRLKIEPLEHKLVVVKLGYLMPDLKRIAGRAFLALSPGAVDQAIERLPFKRLVRPIYPLDAAIQWHP